LFLTRPWGIDIPHVVRLSSWRDLWWQTDRAIKRDNRLDCAAVAALERHLVRAATAAYAPSRYAAQYGRRVHGLEVGVVRPPMPPRVEPGALPPNLPPRYLVHFGSLMRRKGSDRVAEALLRARREAPDLTMVWAGRVLEPALLERYAAVLATGVQQLGALPRDALHAVVAHAVAAVLPSRVDNLPNAVLESLALGTGVIAMRGASVDEVVEEGRNGSLVPAGEVDALAAAMVAAWRGEHAWQRDGFVTPTLFAAHGPARAVADLLAFAGLG
jgi:glycosyltransferase involved in cell wall biosynthesis